MAAMTPEQVERANAATARARAVLKPGDRISRSRCAGLKSTFTFTHWEGVWICGRHVYDCHARHIYRVNGKPVNFDPNH